MKKAHLVKIVLLILTSVTLAGCILIPVDDGFREERHDNGLHRGHDRR